MALLGTPLDQLNAPWNVAVLVSLVPHEVVVLPQSTYGISYDISVRKMEDDAPHGWATPRCAYFISITS